MNSVNARLLFDNARRLIKNAGQNAGNAVLTQSYLRMETLMVAGITQYTFDVLVNENTNPSFNTQNKLNLQDAFVAAEIGVFVATPSSQTDTNYRLLSYPNITAFGLTTAPNVYTLYNGYLTLTVNQRVLLPTWDISRHYKAPQTQQNVITGTYASTVAPAILTGNDDLDLAKDVFYPVEPNIVLNGAKKNLLQIILPGSGFAAVTANSRIVVVMRGILAQNVTAVN